MESNKHAASVLRTLFVRNLPFDTTNHELEQEFAEIGPVKRCYVIKDKDSNHCECKGYGYVTYSMVDDAAKAVKTIFTIRGRKLQVSFSDKRTKIKDHKKETTSNLAEDQKGSDRIENNSKKAKKSDDGQNRLLTKPSIRLPKADLNLSNLPDGTSEKSLKKYLRKIKHVEFVVFPVHGESGLCATIQFQHKAGAKNAMKTLNARKLDGCAVNIQLTERSRDPPDIERPSWQPTTIYGIVIRNLSFKCNEDKLRKEFKRFGLVTRAFIPNKDGKKLGCAFVDFTNETDASKAIEHMNAKEIMGRPVAVDWARHKNEYQTDGVAVPETKINLTADEHDSSDDTVSEAEEISDDEAEEISDDEAEEIGDDKAEEISDDEAEEAVTNDDSEDDREDDREDDSEDASEDAREDASEEEGDDTEEVGDMSLSADDETAPKKKPRKRNEGNSDVEEGKTLFVRNLSYDSQEDDLEEVMSEFGQVMYCRIVLDPNTEHSRGTAFVKFLRKEDADKCLIKANDESKLGGGGLILEKRKLLVTVAVDRNKAKELAKPKDNDKEDKRNLHLVREGLVRPGTQAAHGVSQTDLDKRQKAERMKRIKLKNPNIFISAIRLSVHNIPSSITDQQLKQIFLSAAGDKRAAITECRIMRDLDRVNASGVGKSRGYGFVAFSRHEHALNALRNTNNNGDVFQPDKRPIVEFSLENRLVLEAKQRRAERAVNERSARLRISRSARNTQLAPAPVTDDGKKVKIPKGLPSHWGPKVRHNRPKPQKIPSKPKGKLSRKQITGRRSDTQPVQVRAPPQTTLTRGDNGRKTANRKRKRETVDGFDQLVSRYKATIQRGSAKNSKWFD